MFELDEAGELVLASIGQYSDIVDGPGDALGDFLAVRFVHGGSCVSQVPPDSDSIGKVLCEQPLKPKSLDW